MKFFIEGGVLYENEYGPSRIGMPACFIKDEIQWAYNGKFHRINGFTIDKCDIPYYYSFGNYPEKSVLYGRRLELNVTKLVI